ncbi:MAG: hypothetical protein C4584_00300 [Armatimonadetes bacterium]|nr:MAG: hypothetical protein C4584_00300 [Armatimonadota bacterium]
MKKVVSILFVVVSLVAIPVGIYLTSQQQKTTSKASFSEVPEQVKVTNISDNSLSVSWITPSKATIGFVTYGTAETLGETAFDDRDKSEQKPRYTHHVTLKNLTPDTQYFFKIVSDVGSYDDQGRPWKFKTAPTTEDPPAVADPAFGKVLKNDKTVPFEALVYLTVAGGTPLSSYTREDGNWLITLNNARKADLLTYITYKSSGDKIDIYVQAAGDGIARVAADTKNDAPVPDIILGIDSNFESTSVSGSAELGEDFASGGGALEPVPSVTSVPTPKPTEFSLQAIEEVSESIPLSVEKIDQPNTGKPVFSGTGGPGKKIIIRINSNHEVVDEVIVGSDGTWTYIPKDQLENGEHTVTVDQEGEIVQKVFEVEDAVTPIATHPVKKQGLEAPGDPGITVAVAVFTVLMISIGLMMIRTL